MQFAHVFRCALFVGALAALVHCETLPELAPGVCGNGVKDTGEDCDLIEATSGNCGAPETAGACRFLCVVDADAGSGAEAALPTCPVGFGCGTDGICRTRDVNVPYSPGAPIAVGADRVLTANLAGTGQYSVLAVSRDAIDVGYPRLLAFDRTGAQTADQTLQGSFGLGDVGDVDNDGKDDVLFSRVDGLLLTLGEDATTLNAVASDAIVLPDQARVTLLTVPGSAALGTAGGRTSELMALVSNLGAPKDPTHTYLFGLDISGAGIADFDWPSGNFGSRVSTLPDPAYRCERVVFANRGGTEIDSVQPCCPVVVAPDAQDACAGGQRALPGTPGQRDRLAKTSAPIVYGPWSVDVDGDDRTDVVVATRGRDTSALQLEVAYANDVVPQQTDSAGETTRTLFGTPPRGGAHAVGPGETTVLPLYGPDGESTDAGDGTSKLTTLLDVGTETRDVQVLDAQNRTVTETHRFLTFVDALFVAHAEYTQLLAGQKYQIGLNRASAWTSAKIASFNDDSLLDVVGGQARAVDLDVGLGTPDLGLNVTSVRTGLSTDQLEIADVDGDRVNDVLLSSNTSRDSSTLSVLFGRAGSFPNEISSLGTFERVKQTVAAPLAFGLLGEDSAADVGVVTSAFGPAPGRAETDSVSILRSVGGRLPYSLYGLGPVSVQDTTGRVQRVNASPLASTVVRRGKTTDLVAIGRDFPQPGVTTDPFRLWSGALTTDGRPRLAAAVAGSELAIDALLLGGDDSLDFGFNGLLQGIDIDGDGNEEVVGISSDVARTGAAVFVGAPTATGYGTTLAPTVIPVAADGGPFYRVFGLEVVDVDGDSRLDVVALLASAPALGVDDETDLFDLGDRTAALVVIPNRNGQLVPSAATLLTPPNQIRAIAVGHISDPNARELVVATADDQGNAGIYVFQKAAFNALYTEARGTFVVGGTRSLAVADVTGDGVDDLVVGARDRVTVLRAPTVNP